MTTQQPQTQPAPVAQPAAPGWRFTDWAAI